jgi:glycosyltransferase involved in cell wall biosynthesis
MPAAPFRRPNARSTYLVVSQVYVPDPASVGQHMHDAARELARRGHRVIVYTSGRGYEDPSRRYPRREIVDGVEVRRLPLASFGKSSLATRAAGGLSFLAQAILRGLFVRRLAGVLVTTSPPMGSLAGLVLRRLRGAALTFWVMDVNPDQAVVTGRVRRGSLGARLLERSNRAAARAARRVVFLDRFMAERVGRRWGAGERGAVLPPWPHDDHLEAVPHAENPFRRRLGLPARDEAERVIMYSGNMSPVHPLTTVLEAARELDGTPGLSFLFVGGGAGKREVEDLVARHRLGNARVLPYQPLAELRFSLSAADVHLVTMGDDMVGIVHPSKVYGALRVARPVLFVGPAESHVGEILRASGAGWQVDQGDVAGLVARVREIAALPAAELERRGRLAAAQVEARFSKAHLCGRFCDLVEGRDGALSESNPIASPGCSP